jgi:hypothetical protein
MNDLEIKKILIARLVRLLNPAPSVQELLQRSVQELQEALEAFATAQAEDEAKERIAQHTRELRRATKYDGAWVSVVRNVSINGKTLIDNDSNRQMMENLLQPHEQEEPTSAIYATIAKTWPAKFSWENPPRIQSDLERKADFLAVCRRENLSECLANDQLHRDGAPLDTWVGASGVERAKYASELAQARQVFLRNSATPAQLKTEAAYESQMNREAAQREQADRSHQFVLSQQQGLFPALPQTNQTGEVIDAAYLRKISTINFPLFKQICKKHGSGAVTARLRGQN